MKTRMIIAAMGMTAMMSTGVASAHVTPHDAYYNAFYGMNETMTPPRGVGPMRMSGKAVYGAPTENSERYSRKILSGNNRNTLNRGVMEPMSREGGWAPDGHAIYDRAFNPN
ncbi:hypothetical protein [Nitrogeniibacter aestuarii]|uniref:hypothetical protein n=1 Tax=Nitrogeniibacter aestuarii TaxID=2815343 RepID=UPI001D1136A9|nr:hypothetical protein [Nitrogeniibacter aestuarii]